MAGILRCIRGVITVPPWFRASRPGVPRASGERDLRARRRHVGTALRSAPQVARGTAPTRSQPNRDAALAVTATNSNAVRLSRGAARGTSYNTTRCLYALERGRHRLYFSTTPQCKLHRCRSSVHALLHPQLPPSPQTLSGRHTRTRLSPACAPPSSPCALPAAVSFISSCRVLGHAPSHALPSHAHHVPPGRHLHGQCSTRLRCHRRLRRLREHPHPLQRLP